MYNYLYFPNNNINNSKILYDDTIVNDDTSYIQGDRSVDNIITNFITVWVDSINVQ